MYVAEWMPWCLVSGCEALCVLLQGPGEGVLWAGRAAGAAQLGQRACSGTVGAGGTGLCRRVGRAAAAAPKQACWQMPARPTAGYGLLLCTSPWQSLRDNSQASCKGCMVCGNIAYVQCRVPAAEAQRFCGTFLSAFMCCVLAEVSAPMIITCI